MMRLFKRNLLNLFLISLIIGPIAEAYYGNQSTEAMLTYTASADIIWGEGKPPKLTKGHFRPPFRANSQNWNADFLNKVKNLPKSLLELNTEGPMREKAIELVQTQVQHLMGTLQSSSFKEDFSYFGVLGEQQNFFYNGVPQNNFNIVFTGVSKGSKKGRLMLTYVFTGKTVFDKGAFKSKSTVEVPLRLPLSPDLIYAQSLSNKNGEDFNYCTDENYNSEDDFWYFWDPKKKGCKLANDSKAVLNIKGQLKEIPNSQNRYPNYEKLYGDHDEEKVLKITLLVGYVDEITHHKVGHKKDTSYKNFMEIVSELEAKGFTMLRDSEHYKNNFRITSNDREIKGANFLRHFISNVRTQDSRNIKVEIRMLLADTDVDSTDWTFHKFLVPAFEESDILIYDGHSGLGANLDLESFPEVDFNKKKYQLFFFNGCSSYSYYNGMFFEAKGGTRNLDIVTSGLETSSDSTARNAYAFMKGFIEGRLSSYGTILHYLEQSNGADNGTYLTGVTGETDKNNQKP